VLAYPSQSQRVALSPFTSISVAPRASPSSGLEGMTCTLDVCLRIQGRHEHVLQGGLCAKDANIISNWQPLFPAIDKPPSFRIPQPVACSTPPNPASQLVGQRLMLTRCMRRGEDQQRWPEAAPGVGSEGPASRGDGKRAPGQPLLNLGGSWLCRVYQRRHIDQVGARFDQARHASRVAT
jgi:hypothetical protein